LYTSYFIISTHAIARKEMLKDRKEQPDIRNGMSQNIPEEPSLWFDKPGEPSPWFERKEMLKDFDFPVDKGRSGMVQF